jgi:hypothetical protein
MRFPAAQIRFLAKSDLQTAAGLFEKMPEMEAA